MWICSDDKSDLTWIQIPWKFSLDLEFPMAMRPSMGNLQLEISTWGKFTAKTMVFRCDFPNKTNSLWTLRCTNFWFVYIYTVYKYIYIHVYIYIYKKCVFYMYINPSFSWVSSRFFFVLFTQSFRPRPQHQMVTAKVDQFLQSSLLSAAKMGRSSPTGWLNFFRTGDCCA